MDNLLVSGFIKTSMLDYPGKICSVIFLGGCNFRCGFCHNPEMVLMPEKIPKFDVDSIFKYLTKKKNWIDAVCVTGGEPTLQKGLIDLLKKIKDLGIMVKLDSNGTNPALLKEIIDLKLVDYIAMDIKCSRENYSKIASVNVPLDNLDKSIELIKNSGVDYEFRTTVIPDVYDEDELRSVAKWLGAGTKKYCLQQFNTMKTLSDDYHEKKPYLNSKLEEFGKIAEEFFEIVEVRGI